MISVTLFVKYTVHILLKSRASSTARSRNETNRYVVHPLFPGTGIRNSVDNRGTRFIRRMTQLVYLYLQACRFQLKRSRSANFLALSI